MENREDLNSILPFLPVVLRSSSLFWPPPVVEALKTLSQGPQHSKVDSGEVLFFAISDIRNSLSLADSYTELLSSSAADGYALFFDSFMSKEETAIWFGEVVPAMANLLLRLPLLLETHYQTADNLMLIHGLKMSLRLLESQEPGIVFLSQELIACLLACSFFCLFPVTNRGAKHLPMINFDNLYGTLYESYSGTQKNKIKCIIHYFERISLSMPLGNVSFERKVLPMEHRPFYISYPDATLWAKSIVSLCRFEVHSSGLIEDQNGEALEVDFANKYLGGGALYRGCVQEEIRFMINPELIAGMLFFPSMADNEAIEIVGTERFSNYTGYAASFRFCGDYMDRRDVDSMGRRKMRIVAIDAICRPGKAQYELESLLRETNKAFCGFFYQNKRQQYQRLFQTDGVCESQIDQDSRGSCDMSIYNLLEKSCEASSTSLQASDIILDDHLIMQSKEKGGQLKDHRDEIGIVTGNWGCGAFGGDPELKAMVQWLAASQALRPFISHYTFNVEALQDLDKVTRCIVYHKWTVGHLWNMMVEYSSQRLKDETKFGFFSWLLHSMSVNDDMTVDMPDAL